MPRVRLQFFFSILSLILFTLPLLSLIPSLILSLILNFDLIIMIRSLNIVLNYFYYYLPSLSHILIHFHILFNSHIFLYICFLFNMTEKANKDITQTITYANSTTNQTTTKNPLTPLTPTQNRNNDTNADTNTNQNDTKQILSLKKLNINKQNTIVSSQIETENRNINISTTTPTITINQPTNNTIGSANKNQYNF
eukprot:25073_1